MAKKILIAYGSRYGSTEEIATEMGKILEAEGIFSDIVDLKSRGGPVHNIMDYDGYIIGSGIKMGKWTKEAEGFLKNNYPKLKEGAPLALFVSCGLAEDDHEKALADYLTKIIEKHSIEPDMFDAFGPLYDLSKGSRLGFINKKIIKSMKKDSGRVYEDGKKYDYRDWDSIRDFTLSFEKLLNG